MRYPHNSCVRSRCGQDDARSALSAFASGTVGSATARCESEAHASLLHIDAEHRVDPKYEIAACTGRRGDDEVIDGPATVVEANVANDSQSALGPMGFKTENGVKTAKHVARQMRFSCLGPAWNASGRTRRTAPCQEV